MAEKTYPCISCRKIMQDTRPGVVMCLSCNCIQPTEDALPPINVACGCGAHFPVSETLVGKRFACNKCGQPITVKK